MHRFRFLAVAALTLASIASSPVMAADATADTQARNTWQGEQAVMRTASKMEVSTKGSVNPEVFWLFAERTPSGGMRVVIRKGEEAKPHLTMLVQDAVSMALAGDEAEPVAAPWMLGQHLFGQAVEPSMLFHWVLGLPGKDFTVGAAEASVSMDNKHVASIEQSGWRVDYLAWKDEVEGSPSLPSQFLMTGKDVSVKVSHVIVEAHAVEPDGYKGFRIM